MEKLSSAKSSLSKDLKEYKSECRVKEERLVGLGEELSALQARVSSLAEAEECLSTELSAAKEVRRMVILACCASTEVSHRSSSRRVLQ